MLQQVSFTNFKSLRRVDARLGRFMVIVGPNGSGKTSILDGLHYLARTTQAPLASVMRGTFDPPNLKSRGSTDAMRLAVTGSFHDVTAGVEVGVECDSDASGTSYWSATVALRWGDAVEETAESAAELRHIKPPPPVSLARLPPETPGRLRSYHRPEMAELASELGSSRKLRLDVEALAAPSYSEEETPRLAMDGRDLASVLADAATRTPETFQSIQEAARRVIPALDRIRTRRAKVQRREYQEVRIDDAPMQHAVARSYWGQQLVLDFKGAPDVPAPLASEGTLLVIGLLTALWMAPRPRLLLLDDIDKALHPRAQEELVAQIRRILELSPELQVIATSHSPYLLDHFDAQDVLLTALLPDGSTACAPLAEHPDFDRWKTTTRSGELWSFVGEDWVAQRAGAPQAHE
ncbi:AAA family ATPase [Sorangium sp. So ce204]|uniref:AAA family ATPase n=1 Tax=Sorangium sp. So ce204 TaxID=3133288 RepID=UPI003F5D98B4